MSVLIRQVHDGEMVIKSNSDKRNSIIDDYNDGGDAINGYDESRDDCNNNSSTSIGEYYNNNVKDIDYGDKSQNNDNVDNSNQRYYDYYYCS